MSTEQRHGASVSQSLAINRLLEFIIVSSYDVEEPRGLGEREEDSARSLTGCWLIRWSLYWLQCPYQFHLSWVSSPERRHPSCWNGWHGMMEQIGKKWATVHDTILFTVFRVLVWQRAGWLPLDTDHSFISHNGKGHVMCDLPQIKHGRQSTATYTDAKCQRTKITSKMPAEVWM